MIRNTKRRLVSLVAIALAVGVPAVFVSAQPVTPSGLKVVTHGSALTGSGTVAAPLNLAPQGCGSGSAASGWGSDGTPTCVAAGGVTDGTYSDITVSGGGISWLIGAGKVTLAKMADLATARILCRITAGTGVPEACTASQATSLLNVVTTGAKGLVPAPPFGGDPTYWLNGFATWAQLPTASTSTTASGVVPGGNGAGSGSYLGADIAFHALPTPLVFPYSTVGNITDVDLTTAGMTAAHTAIFLSNSSTQTLRGIPFPVDGKCIQVFKNAGSLIVQHENAAATATARINTNGGVSYTRPARSLEIFCYNGDAAVQRWFLRDSIELPSLTVDGLASLPGGATIGGVTNVNDFRGNSQTTATISGTVSNWAPSNLVFANIIRITSTGAALITGMQGCSNSRWMTWINTSANPVTFSNQDGTETTATQRFLVYDGTSPVLGTDGVAIGNCDTTTGRWRIIYYTPAAQNGKTWVYGDGSDGACAFDGTTTVAGVVPSASIYTLDVDPHCTTIAVSAGVSVQTRSFHLFATSTVTIAATGKIEANGFAGSNGTTSAGGNGGSGGGDAFGSTGTLGARGISGGSGGFGSGAGTAVSCTNGWPGTVTPSSGNGGSGSGGVGGVGGLSGAGATVALASKHDGSIHDIWQAMLYTKVGNTTYFAAGCGGGGGGGAQSASVVNTGGGGGGGGGGIVWITAPSFATTGSIEAKGGAGGNGVANGLATGAGGGGGTGGVILLLTPDTTLPTLSVTGGAGGTGSAAGGTGSNGYTLTYAPSGV